jgi:hypothetical protein
VPLLWFLLSPDSRYAVKFTVFALVWLCAVEPRATRCLRAAPLVLGSRSRRFPRISSDLCTG